MISLKKWFRSTLAPRDGLTQSQREAIVDLLNYCSLVDRNIADSEDITIDELESQLDWDAKTDFNYYVNKSIGSVRRALESKDEPFFVQEIQKKLDSRRSRETAIKLCEKLIRADGRFSAEESATFAAIKAAFAEAKKG